MSGRKTRDEIERQLAGVRRQLRGRHAGIEPDAQFAARVVARLPQAETWSLDWAARRVLPVSLALATALFIAVLATGRATDRAITQASVSATAQSASDPLEWLLETHEERR